MEMMSVADHSMVCCVAASSLPTAVSPPSFMMPQNLEVWRTPRGWSCFQRPSMLLQEQLPSRSMAFYLLAI